MNTTIIFGPPGTGKTTTLLNTVEQHLNSGLPPRQLGFVAFTRRAAHEARSRALDKFRLNEADMPWYRTLHSAAFRLLGLNRSQVMSASDYITICRHLGLYITLKRDQEDDSFAGMTKGDRLFFTENMARVRGMSLRDMWSSIPDEDLEWVELERLRLTLEEYKRREGKMDFTDMIDGVVSQGLSMPVEVAFVDEAQDLSPLQWAAVDALFRSVNRLYISGDDDQAIFNWAGADSKELMTRSGERKFLPQSYRVPSTIQALASKIITRVEHRVVKDWRSTAAIGEIHHCSSLDQIDMGAGTWLLLSRNVAFLKEFTHHCLTAGYVFDCTIDSPLRGESLKGIVIWEKLRRGERVPISDAVLVYGFISSKTGVVYGKKTHLERRKHEETVDIAELESTYGLRTRRIWHEALDMISETEKQYFLAALKRGEKLLREPRIRISTIHGSKGGEADNVVLMTDMARRSWKEYEVNQDDEHRVWYVAATRAKQRLYLLEPCTSMFYGIS